MYHKKESDKTSFNHRQNFDNSVARSVGYTVVNSNQLPTGVDQGSRVDKSYGALYIDNFARSNLNPVL